MWCALWIQICVGVAWEDKNIQFSHVTIERQWYVQSQWPLAGGIFLWKISSPKNPTPPKQSWEHNGIPLLSKPHKAVLYEQETTTVNYQKPKMNQ